ncbi:hypothetical protein BU15DRAFT_66897 [Melanogaster broomeanus]|nr:hypothetical protein BU15DRAFT_66897 [Melanogaster broomeanus]
MTSIIIDTFCYHLKSTAWSYGHHARQRFRGFGTRTTTQQFLKDIPASVTDCQWSPPFHLHASAITITITIATPHYLFHPPPFHHVAGERLERPLTRHWGLVPPTAHQRLGASESNLCPSPPFWFPVTSTEAHLERPLSRCRGLVPRDCTSIGLEPLRATSVAVIHMLTILSHFSLVPTYLKDAIHHRRATVQTPLFNAVGDVPCFCSLVDFHGVRGSGSAKKRSDSPACSILPQTASLQHSEMKKLPAIADFPPVAEDVDIDAPRVLRNRKVLSLPSKLGPASSMPPFKVGPPKGISHNSQKKSTGTVDNAEGQHMNVTADNVPLAEVDEGRNATVSLSHTPGATD